MDWFMYTLQCAFYGGGVFFFICASGVLAGMSVTLTTIASKK